MDRVIRYMDHVLAVVKVNLQANRQRLLMSNVTDNAVATITGYFYHYVNDNILIICANLYQAQKIYDKLVQVLGSLDVHFFPMDEFISAEMLASSNEFRIERINTIASIIRTKKGIIVTHTIGAIRKLPPKEVLVSSIISMKEKEIYDFDDLIARFISLGYTRTTLVENPGEFTVRGGIIDIFPLTNQHPYRIEFFGDEVESLRFFDEKTQRTISKTNEVLITPVYELVYTDEVKHKAIQKLTDIFNEKCKNVKPQALEKLREAFDKDLRSIENYQDLARIHKYITYFYDRNATIFDLLNDGLLVFVDYQNIYNNYQNFNSEYQEFYTDLLLEQKSVIVPEHYRKLDSFQDYPNNQVFLQEFVSFNKDIKFTYIYDFNSRKIEQYYGVLSDFLAEVKRNTDKTYCICLPNSSQIEALSEELHNANIKHALIGEKDEIIPHIVNLMISNLPEGFELISENIKFVTNFELYKKVSKVIKYRSTLKEGKKIKDIDELKVGDYVVHNVHGIGQYLGIKTLVTDGVHKDYLQIAYKGEDKLYVPVENINMIQKYVGSEGARPKINKLGSTEWLKTKQRVQKRVKDIAQKLIQLYALREQTPGFAFSPDTDEQREFEAKFEYVETPDQLQAIQEVKADMEKPTPMDRLLCGDVGYGKTEVAMRAAFKAVMDNKQVAYLAPTTILTQQHYENFVKRFKDYPVNIALLNRFVPKKKQDEVIAKLKKGQIDIVIGTHRLLSSDVSFYDLGLLIIDEEQRFGVEHKERLKELKVSVDVLTLSATPIPRTLQMSLIGVRSLSLLETPPENRYPVQTYVLEENDTVIKEAIERELARHGQVFYLYNRIEDIERKVEKLKQLVPDARITFVHGRMSKEQLEDTMLAFLNNEYDVLVCTTIIETGIDIANANTLIVSDADHLGLAQLYQLRGRVGRSDRIAYAYLMYQKRKVLTEVASKRLQAIKDFTELGAGFKIAKQDLAIRGSGDLLGAQQYGFIDSVGYELYNQLLKEAITELRQADEEKEPLAVNDKDLEMKVLVDAYIPDEYIADESLKIEVYKKIKNIGSEADLLDLESELTDRFSTIPEPVENLLNLAFIKSCCLDLGITRMLETKTYVEYEFSEAASQKINGEQLFICANETSRNITLRYLRNKVYIVIDKPRLKENYLKLSRKLFVKIIHSRIM
ncbi:MAG: transcription-repair coupling factor [Bacilli bacterium]|nr:transcription-repair coupling factor [Bacilli bacterium]